MTKDVNVVQLHFEYLENYLFKNTFTESGHFQTCFPSRKFSEILPSKSQSERPSQNIVIQNSQTLPVNFEPVFWKS